MRVWGEGSVRMTLTFLSLWCHLLSQEYCRSGCRVKIKEKLTLRCLGNTQEELPTRQLDCGSGVQRTRSGWR